MNYLEVKKWLASDPWGQLCINVLSGLILFGLGIFAKFLFKKAVERWAGVKKNMVSKLLAHYGGPRVIFLIYYSNGNYPKAALLVLGYVAKFILESIFAAFFGVCFYFSAEQYGGTVWTILFCVLSLQALYALLKDMFVLGEFYHDVISDVVAAQKFIEKFPMKDDTTFGEVIDSFQQSRNATEPRETDNALPR
jgi:hypothetical protein